VASLMFPFRSSIQRGLLFARRGPASLVPPRQRSYRALRLPLRIRPRLWSPLPSAFGAQPSSRVSQVTGSSSSTAPRTKTPSRTSSSSPLPERRYCLPANGRLGPGTLITVFGADFSRLTRSRAYASPDTLPSRFIPNFHIRPSQGSLPTCLASFDRAGFAPAR
jgi:hypothetical protein